MTYAEEKGINWSRLKNMLTSPLQYRHELTASFDSAACRLGTGGHRAVLEPETFDSHFCVIGGPIPNYCKPIWEAISDGTFESRFILFPEQGRRGNAWKKFQKDHAGATLPIVTQGEYDRSVDLGEQIDDREVLTAAQRETSLAMAEAVHAHPVVRSEGLLQGGEPEKAITWTDPIQNLPCKARADYLAPRRLVDLKTTGKPIAGPRFPAVVADGLWHAQLAFYKAGALIQELLEPHGEVWIIAVQSSAPYDVACHRLDKAVLEAGERLYKGLLRRLKGCLAMYGDRRPWPGQAPQALTLDNLPAWAPGMEE